MMRYALMFALLGALLASGCRSRSKAENTIELDQSKLKSVDLPPSKALTVDFESKDNVSVTACLVKTEDADEALKAVESGKSPEQAVSGVKTLARLEQPKGTLTTPNADAKTKWSVLLFSKKPTSVTVRSKDK